jgi:hypothetical protein
VGSVLAQLKELVQELFPGEEYDVPRPGAAVQAGAVPAEASNQRAKRKAMDVEASPSDNSAQSWAADDAGRGSGDAGSGPASAGGWRAARLRAILPACFGHCWEDRLRSMCLLMASGAGVDAPCTELYRSF